MEVPQLLEYLRYLRRRIDVLISGTIIGEPEIAAGHAVRSRFRERACEFQFLDAKAREFLGAVVLEIPAVHLAGSREHFRQTWWMNLPWIRILLGERRREKDREIIDAQLARLREEIYALYCLVEVSARDA